MIVERLFTRRSESLVPMNTTLDQRVFNEVEENAIYYVAGYIIRKLLWKHDNLKGEDSKQFAAALWEMLGEDCSSIKSTSSYYDYVKVWTRTQDRGGLKHVSSDTFNCFKAIEVVTYSLIEKGYEKQYVITEAHSDANILFHWELISELEGEKSLRLLQEVIELWFTVRGFAIANRLFEEYKTASKTNVKGKKALRKTLQ